MQLCVLMGNPKSGSRTLAAAETLARRLAGPYDNVEVVDLAHHTADLFTWPSDQMDMLAARVAGSEIVIVGSPTYKATYTGLLKSFLDRYPSGGLSGVCAVPLMTGADRGHAMAPDVGLRPLLVELGASVPTASLYVETPKIDGLDELVDGWLGQNAALLARAVGAPTQPQVSAR